MNEDHNDHKITLNLTDKLREKLNDLMSIDNDSETDVIFDSIEKLHTEKFVPYKRMMELKERNSKIEKSEEDSSNPFNFERNTVSDEAYLATLEDELREFKNRGDTEMIFLTREKIDKVKDKIRKGRAY